VLILYSHATIGAAYAPTKAAIVAFTEALSRQLIANGIRVNAVAPGPFWTPLRPCGGQSQDTLVTFGGSTPYGRPGRPAEIAPTYVLLAAQDASYVAGEVFGNTGGKSF